MCKSFATVKIAIGIEILVEYMKTMLIVFGIGLRRTDRTSLVVQCVKDPALSLLWLRSLLWREFDPWPGNFHMLQIWPKKKKRRNKRHILQHQFQKHFVCLLLFLHTFYLSDRVFSSWIT